MAMLELSQPHWISRSVVELRTCRGTAEDCLAYSSLNCCYRSGSLWRLRGHRTSSHCPKIVCQNIVVAIAAERMHASGVSRSSSCCLNLLITINEIIIALKFNL